MARARASGGLTIVNAIGHGRLGGAAGLGLWVESRVREARGLWAGVSLTPRGERRLPPRVLEAAATAACSLGACVEGLEAEVHTGFPPGVGLKGSAALLASLVQAVLRLKGVRVPPWRAALAAARVSRGAGLSVTGALDDHAASLLEAPVITDNRGMAILRLLPRDGCRLTAVIGVPGAENPVENLDPSPFRRHSRLYDAAARLGLAGEWLPAMAVSGVAGALALGVEGLASRLYEAGAAAAGVTGKGPAVFALTERPRGAAEVLETAGYEVVEARFKWCG
ncbi:shikimate kinase [Aeropyrum pernix]|uniref:Shikimate kinase n=1 Tax=Aeropyrum pernix TaxID=56636 RepID=A0A401HA64_AERPX|nr:shikimate kinase [Aeropyrum pernix]GBF09356.1 shikimate kinase [Aeropyrum pernix]